MPEPAFLDDRASRNLAGDLLLCAVPRAGLSEKQPRAPASPRDPDRVGWRMKYQLAAAERSLLHPDTGSRFHADRQAPFGRVPGPMVVQRLSSASRSALRARDRRERTVPTGMPRQLAASS